MPYPCILINRKCFIFVINEKLNEKCNKQWFTITKYTPIQLVRLYFSPLLNDFYLHVVYLHEGAREKCRLLSLKCAPQAKIFSKNA